MVDPWGGAVADMADALLAEIDVQLAKQFHHMGCGGLAPHDQASVGQSLMRDELVGHPVGRQYGIEASFQIDHQRMVVEAVLMVVHVATVEEECSILRLGYKVVPCGLLLAAISFYLEHRGKATCRLSLRRHTGGTRRIPRYSRPHRKVRWPAPCRRLPRRSRRVCARSLSPPRVLPTDG